MKYKVTLNNKVFVVEVEEGDAVLIDEYEAASPAPAAAVIPAPVPAAVPAASPAPAAAAAVTGAGEQVVSPMPGNILDVRAASGAAVKAGDIIIILEAMKMENEIVAPSDGTITQMVVTKGQTVDTGDVLFVIG